MRDGTLVMMGWPPPVVQSAGRWRRLVSSFPRALSTPPPPAVRSPNHHALTNGPGYAAGAGIMPSWSCGRGYARGGEPRAGKMGPLNYIRAQGGR